MELKKVKNKNKATSSTH